MPITIGADAIDRDSDFGHGSLNFVIIEESNPSSVAGKLSKSKVYIASGTGVGIKIGLFYKPAPNTFTLRAAGDSFSISPGYNEHDEDIDVQVGDYIGALLSFPRQIDWSASGGVGYWYVQRDNINLSDTLCTYTALAILSLGGEITLPVTIPTLTTQACTSVEATTATGNGNITDNGGEDCDKRGIVYGTTSQGDPGNVAPAVSGYDSYEEETGSFGTGAFTQALTSLEPKTTYYVRAYAHNSAGYSYGNEVSFTTLVADPIVTTNPTSNIEPTTVTLNGTLDYDGGEACACGFEYGETTDYGSTTDTEGKTTGETFSQGVQGLKSGTVYHFRAIATNSGGASYGADRTFHTEALSAAAHQALGKSYPLGRAEV